MTIRVQLLVSEWCTPCRAAEEAWRQVAQRKDIAFEVLDVAQREGRAVVARLGVKSVPATVVDGVLRHVGVPTGRQAMEFVAGAPDRTEQGMRYVGLALSGTSRWAIASSAIYLALAASSLLFGGDFAGDAPWRAAALHTFGLGFLTMIIFGLGEHMLPRFVGAPIRSGRLAWIQLGLVHAGLLLLVAGVAAGVRTVAACGGLLAWSAFAVFAFRIAPVLRHPDGANVTGP